MGLEFGMERSQHFLMPAPAHGSNCNLLIFNTVSKEDTGYNIEMAFYNNILDTRGSNTTALNRNVSFGGSQLGLNSRQVQQCWEHAEFSNTRPKPKDGFRNQHR